MTSTFHFSAIEKSDVEKLIANSSTSELGTFKQNALK